MFEFFKFRIKMLSNSLIKTSSGKIMLDFSKFVL